MISGRVGVGRSRLAREVCAATGRVGDLHYWAQGTRSSAGIPLGAFAALIPDEVRSDEPLELIRRSSEWVQAHAAGRNVTVGIDDAHLLDSASASLALHLATAAGAFVVATIRAGEPTPDAVDSLWKDAGAQRIELPPLDDEAIEKLVEAALPGPIEQAVIRRVVDASAGNVLYARELLTGALEEGRLTFDAGLWRLRRAGVSPSLVALVTARLGRLDDAERSALELLAFGEPLRLGEVGTLVGTELLEILEERGMINVDAGSSDAVVRLGQPLYGEVLRKQVPTLRSRSLQMQLAETVALRHPVTPDDALRIARWRLAAGADVPGEHLLDAAREANFAGDPGLAIQLSKRALADGLGLPATLTLSRAYMLRNGFKDAERVLAGAETQAAGHSGAPEYIAQRVHVLYWGLAKASEARAFLDRASLWSEDSQWSRLLDPWQLIVSGMLDGIEEYGDGDISIPEQLADPQLDAPDRRRIELAHTFRLMAAGRVKEADALARELRPRVPLRGNHDAYALAFQCNIGVEGGEDWVDLEQYLTRTMRDGVRAGDHQAAGLSSFTLAVMAMARGRYRDVRRWLAEAEGHFAVQDAFGTAFNARAIEVGLAFFSGDLIGARSGLAAVRAMLDAHPQLALQTGFLARAEGWAARALSDAAGAKIFLTAAAAADQPMLASRLLHEALRAGSPPAPIAAQQERLARRCDARLVSAYAAHSTALAANDASALMAVAEEFAAIGADVYAMEAAVEAARLFIGSGREDSARRAATRARDLYATDEGVDFPIIDGLDAVAVELSPREAQIATLAAGGLSNQEIAEQLVLSVRTVETYVYRAMQKRGVSNRREL